MSGMLLVDVRLGGLQLPASLSDFLRLQRLHREEAQEQLGNDWTIKVGGGQAGGCGVSLGTTGPSR